MGRPPLESLYEEEKALAEIKRLADKYQLELDSDFEALVKHVVHGHYVGGISRLASKEWFLNEALKYWGELRDKKIYGSQTQRAFEVIGEILGYLGNSNNQKTPTLVDVTIDALNKAKK